MSGAEIVFGLGIACNAMQIIGFGREVYSVAKHLQESSSPGPHLSHYGASVTSTFKAIQDEAARVSQRRPLRPEETKVIESAQKCAEATDRMISMLDDMRPSEGKTGLRKGISTFGKGFKAAWHKRDLEKAEKVLMSQQRLLETQQLASICSQNEAAEIQASDRFSNLDHKLQHFISQYAAGVTILSGIVVEDGQATRDHVTATGENVKSHIDESTTLIRKDLLQLEEARYTEEEYDGLLSSLRFPEMSGRKNRIPDRLTDTFSWVFDEDNDGRASNDDHEDRIFDGRESNDRGHMDDDSALRYQKYFKHWLHSDGKVFWIHGKPGSGKSTLMKFIVSRLEQGACVTHGSQEPIILSYFFWKPGTELQHSVRGMLCSLLHQLLEQDTILVSTFGSRQALAHKKSQHDWSILELYTLLRDQLTACSSIVLILLDGLDEIIETEDSMLDSLEFLSSMKSIENVRTCVASRSERRFLKHFEDAPCLTMQQVNRKDISLLIESRLVSRVEISQAEREDLLTSVTRGADGVFLWALLVVRSLNRGVQDGNTIRELQDRLRTLPRDLESLYEDMWQRLGDDTTAYRQTAAQFFHCVKSKRILDNWPIDVLEIAAATDDSFLGYYELLKDGSWQISERDIIKIDEICQQTRNRIDTRCAGLLTSTEESPRSWRYMPRAPLASRVLHHATADITWVHRSALDFLTDTSAGQSIMASCDWTVEEKWERITKGTLLSKVLVMHDPRYGEMCTPHGVYQPHIHWIFDHYNQISVVEGNKPLLGDMLSEEKSKMVETVHAVLDGVRVAPRPHTGSCPAVWGDFGVLYYQAMFERADVVINRLEALSLDEFLAVGHEPLLGAATFDSDGDTANFQFTTRRDKLIRYILLRVQSQISDGTLSSSWNYAFRQVHWSLVCGGITLAGEYMRFRKSWTSDLLKALCHTLDLFHNLSPMLQALIGLHGNFQFGLTANRVGESFNDHCEGFVPPWGHMLDSVYFGFYILPGPGYFVMMQASYTWAKRFIRSIAATGDDKAPCEAQLEASPKALIIFYDNTLIIGDQFSTHLRHVILPDADLSLVDQTMGPLFGPKTGWEAFDMSILDEAVRRVASEKGRPDGNSNHLQTYLELECCFHPVTKRGLWTNMPCVRSVFTPEELEEADRIGRQNLV